VFDYQFGDLTFIVSDGLYFGQGLFEMMKNDPMAVPFVNKSIELLQAIVNKTLENSE
jgi:hypothetical protein